MSAPESYGPFAAARRADILAAFDVHLTAEDRLYESPERLALTRAEFAAALVGARLPGEARMLLELALPDLTSTRPATAHARLLLATVELLTGDVRRAEDTASTALTEFRRLGRATWEPRARDVLLRARLAQRAESGLEDGPPQRRPTQADGSGLGGTVSAGLPTHRTRLDDVLRQAASGFHDGLSAGLGARADETGPDDGLLGECAAGADELEAAGWRSEADELRLFAVSAFVRRCGRGLGGLVVAQRMLDRVRDGSGCVATRFHAEALRRWAGGDLGEALELAQRGFTESLREMARLASDTAAGSVTETPGSTPLPMSRHRDTKAGDPGRNATPACGESIRLPDEISKRYGTGTDPAGFHRTTPPPISESGQAMRMSRNFGTSTLGAVPHVKRLADERWRVSRVAEEIATLGLELVIRQQSADKVLLWSERWRALVSGAEPVAGRPEVLVELVRDQDALHAVVAHGDRVSLHDLGSLSAVTEAMVRIRYNLRRRNLRDTRPEGEEGLSPGLMRELSTLDEALIRPLGLPPGAVSMVPTVALHSLPWSLLPSLRGRAVSVAPSAALAVARRRAGGPVVALAGPDLAHAEEEVAAVVGVHEKGERVPATRGALLAALGRAGIVHIAAHGIFSGRRPMMSSILLDDGPLLVHEFFRLTRVPPLVVLSSCDAGMASAPADGAAFGLAGAFLDRGASTVIAGIVPVRDDEAARLMVEFHRLLAQGEPPAQALAAAATTTDVPGFACFGTG
ncbi:CHAT domain-containing protein [Herbidospora sp. NEAU-GS84]|uniref:CHAT domain-containing protein n=1 Tax=Herbidospora solisilvae TaxID=2696284 RepID=A0A7C9MYT6_9ACTN|nr:CHAT domain-containing protein [Herbidospora solisilvae]NAS21410.1 CHAT domain-containing protein [Herbidospora solisilvae]